MASQPHFGPTDSAPRDIATTRSDPRAGRARRHTSTQAEHLLAALAAGQPSEQPAAQPENPSLVPFRLPELSGQGVDRPPARGEIDLAIELGRTRIGPDDAL